MKKLGMDTIVFVIIMTIIILLYLGGGFIFTLPTLGSIGIGSLLLFSIITFWFLHKKPKIKKGGVR